MIHCRYIILEKLRTLRTLNHSSIKHADREAFFSEKKTRTHIFTLLQDF